MGSILHGSARTTPRVRAELQRAQGSTRTLATRYQLNPKTVSKWRRRTVTSDAPMGPRHVHNGHNGLFSVPFVDFLRRYITDIEVKRQRRTAQYRRQFRTALTGIDSM